MQAEKARCNVWQWLSLDQSLAMPDGSSRVLDTALLDQAMDEVGQQAPTPTPAHACLPA